MDNGEITMKKFFLENAAILTFVVGMLAIVFFQVESIRADVREIRKSVASVSNGVADNRSRLALVAFATKHGFAYKLPPHIINGAVTPQVAVTPPVKAVTPPKKKE